MNWKRLLKFECGDLFGLDIGSASIKMIQLRKTKAGYTVVGSGITSIPNQTSDNANIQTGTIANVIQSCYERSGIETQLAVCGVCGPDVAVRTFKFPLLGANEIEGAVQLEAGQVCPFDVRQKGTVDHQVILKDEHNIHGIFVAATNETINKSRSDAENALIKCVSVGVDGLSLLNCFEKCEKPETGKATAILNVGNTFTTLTIMGEDSLPFIRDIAYGGKDIMRQEKVGSNLETACKELINDVTKTLRYYTAQEKTTIEKIFICGGFALTEGFVETVNNNLEATAVLWNPLVNIDCSENLNCKEMLENEGPAFAVAAGLAMQIV